MYRISQKIDGILVCCVVRCVKLREALFYFSQLVTLPNQSVENPGVAFVKGANERNEFFEKT